MSVINIVLSNLFDLIINPISELDFYMLVSFALYPM